MSDRAPVAAVIALALGTLAFGACFPLFLSTPIPQGDIFDFYRQFVEAGGFSGFGFTEIYRWHNEHRLVVPKLWFLADVALVDARQTFLLGVIFLSAMLHAALLAALFRGLGQSWRATALAFLVAAAAMASPVQYENLLNGFQVQFVQVWLFASLAFALIAWAPVRAGRPILVALSVLGAILAGLGSTYSMFNGLAVWPLLVVFALWRRLPLLWSLTIAAVGGAVIAIEVTAFMGRPGSGGALATHVDPGTILLFMARYLTSAIGEIGTLGQEIVGIAAIAAVVIAGLYALVRPSRTPAVRMALFAICGFLLAAALATALGRLHIGLGAANASRYTTPSMVFLVTVGMIGFDALMRLRRPRLTRWALAAAAVVLLLPGAIHGVRHMPDRLAGKDLASLAIVSHLAGGYRPDTLRLVFPHWPPLPDGVLQGMEAAQLGPFSQLERFMPPSDALVDGPAINAPVCDGVVDGLRIDPVTGVIFSAWLTDPATGRRASWVVARDPDGQVIAWGAALEMRTDRAPIEEAGLFTRGLRAFGEAPDPIVDTVTVEGVFADASRCRLPGTVAALPDRYLTDLPAEAGPAVLEPWAFEGETLAGGVGTAAVPEAARPVFGSNGLHDRRFVASAPLGEPGAARGVLVPIHTEHRPFGTTIALHGPDGEVLDEIRLTRPSEAGWTWAVLGRDRLVAGMRVVIRTDQRHPLNGVAFGTPHWLP